MTELTKDAARAEAIRRWRDLPEKERSTREDAQVFAAALAEILDFRTMANNRRLIESWLTNDLAGLPPWGNVLPESETPPNFEDHKPGETEDRSQTARRRSG